ncbi:PREDICTED: uncharacterized protein LOC103328466 [Prunus mume]|uniref:Uncharacterized protein LOC103328466 n=1 Tax=Prunus mume TaxID=102107 RepID=A0ABM0NSA4_PRUMU|nr:PREDICTED: uncharacterized protein LOC103328466 [Prunus mume]
MSDYGGEGKMRHQVILACEMSGNYKSCKSSETTDVRLEANGDTKKCARDTGTKKCGCPFLLEGVNIGDGDDRKLEVVCGVHNHPISEYLQGHSFVGQLSEEENALLVDMSKSLVKPRDILVTLKYRDAMNVSTMKTIYNARI